MAATATTFDGDTEAGSTGGAYGATLLIGASLLYYFISIEPFVDLTAMATLDPATERSNALNQAVFLALTAGLWITGFGSPARTLIARPRLLIVLIALWFLAVSAVSAHPDLAVKRAVLAGLTLVNASVLLILPRTEAQFVRVLSVCCLVALLVAYAGVLFLPRFAIHQASEIREPMNAGFWRGQFPHKNTAAAAMVLFSFFGLYIAAAGLRVRGAAIVVLAVVFLLQTGGKTSTAALPAILVVAGIFEKVRPLRVPLVIGGIVAFNVLAIGSSVSTAIQEFVTALGIDPTFTNRTDIWRIAATAIAEHPIAGYGFQLFWQTGETVNSRGGGASWAVAAFNGHNAYLDMALTTGLPGLVLTLALLVLLPLRDVARADGNANSASLTRLFVRIWLYGVFTACVESIFFESGNLVWFAFVVAVFGLRMQAHASMNPPRVARAGNPVHSHA
ncbi:MAG: O-antigen ligase [Methylobacterium sp.]